jgi:hypothetical protein
MPTTSEGRLPLKNPKPGVGVVCVPNINSAEGRKRLAAGVIQFFISLTVLAALITFWLYVPQSLK